MTPLDGGYCSLSQSSQIIPWAFLHTMPGRLSNKPWGQHDDDVACNNNAGSKVLQDTSVLTAGMGL